MIKCGCPQILTWMQRRNSKILVENARKIIMRKGCGKLMDLKHTNKESNFIQLNRQEKNLPDMQIDESCSQDFKS